MIFTPYYTLIKYTLIEYTLIKYNKLNIKLIYLFISLFVLQLSTIDT